MTSVFLRLPERLLRLHLLRRGVALSVAVRLMAGLAISFTGPLSATAVIDLSPITVLLLMPMVGAFGLLDAMRCNEHRFLANLGVPYPTIVVLSMVPYPLVDLLIRFVL